MSAILLSRTLVYPPGRAWLITFVDLILLLLTFFILLYSMSQPDPARYAPMAQSYAQSFSLVSDDDPVLGRARSFVTQADRQGDNLKYLESALKSAFSQSPALQAIQFSATDQYLMISLPGDILDQESGSAGVMKPELYDLGGVFANLENRLAVIGLADQTAESWAAAIGRAGLAARALTRAGYDRPIATLARAGGANQNALEIMIMANRATEPEVAP